MARTLVFVPDDDLMIEYLLLQKQNDNTKCCRFARINTTFHFVIEENGCREIYHPDNWTTKIHEKYNNGYITTDSYITNEILTIPEKIKDIVKYLNILYRIAFLENLLIEIIPMESLINDGDISYVSNVFERFKMSGLIQKSQLIKLNEIHTKYTNMSPRLALKDKNIYIYKRL